MSKKIVEHDNEGMITSIWDFTAINKAYLDRLSLKYKIFESFNGCDNDNINFFDDKGTLLPNSTLVSKALIRLQDDEKIEDGEIVKKNEVDLYRDSPLGENNIDKKIIIDDNGVEAIVEKSMLEKYNENIISKESYNNYIDEMRSGEYSSIVDKKTNELNRKKLLNPSYDDSVLLKEIKDETLKIKEKYAKV